jgi:hypothetical protein
MAEQAEVEPAEDSGKGKVAQSKDPDYEEIARKEGWKSKEELGDEFDPARYVGAEEFIKRKPLFDTIKQQNKKIKELIGTVDSVVSFSQKNAELAAKKAIAELNAQKKEAIKLGDADTVEAIDRSLDDQKTIVAEAAKVKKTDSVPSEIIEWTEKNPWFNDDPEMQEDAVALTAAYAKKHPKAGMEEALADTEKKIKALYPDSKYFKKRRNDPPPVETHQSDGADPSGNGNKKYTMGRLNEDQKLTYNAYVKKAKMMTHDQFFSKLEEIGDLAK